MTTPEEYAHGRCDAGSVVWQPENDDASKTGHATTAAEASHMPIECTVYVIAIF